MINYNYVLSLQCCEEAKKSKVVFLAFGRGYPAIVENIPDDPSYEGPYMTYKGHKPSWHSVGVSKEYSCTEWVKVKCCPFCKTDVPDLEINPNAKEEDVHEGDEDYCNTCGQRNRSCMCLPPEWRWKPVGFDIQIPEKIKEDEED